jgi:hypothetical protein
VVENITTDILDAVNKLAPKDMDKDKVPMDVPVKQLAVLLGVKSETLQKFDLRIIGKVLSFIMDEVTKGLDTIKSPSSAEVRH